MILSEQVSLAPSPLCEFPLTEPQPGETSLAHTVARAVGGYWQGCRRGEVALGIASVNTLELIEDTLEAAYECADRAVLASLQAARRAQPPRRLTELAQFYLQGSEQQDGEVSIEPRLSFSFDGDGRLLSQEEEDQQRTEASNRAETIGDTWRLAYPRAFQPREALLIRLALERQANRGRTEADKREAAQALATLFMAA